MESLFQKDTVLRPPASPYEQIAKEIAHLDKKTSVRKNGDKSRMGRILIAMAVCTVLTLYFMDPFLYALHKGNAIRAYLYLYNYGGGNQPKLQALVASNILSEREIYELNHRQGSFQDYFESPQQAEQKAESTVAFMNDLKELRDGNYKQLDPIGKLRYILFVRAGLLPPTAWSGLNPTVEN